jgi:hypothetical protein
MKTIFDVKELEIDKTSYTKKKGLFIFHSKSNENKKPIF